MIRRAKEKLVLQYGSAVNFFDDALQRMRTHEGFKRYFKNTGWLFLGRMFSLGTSFFVGAYIARYLGPEQYGLLSYVVSFVGLFAIISNFGIDGILSRKLVLQSEDKDKLLGTGFYTKIFASLFAILILFVFSLLINSDPLTNLLIVLFSTTFIFQAFGVIDLYFQSQVLSKKTVQMQVFSTIASALIKLIFMILGLGVSWFVVAYVIDSALLGVGFMIVFRANKFTIRSWRFDWLLCKNILRDSWPLMLSGASVAIYSRVDQVMIGRYLSNEAVGVYSAAVKIAEVWYFVPTLICASVFPALVNAKRTNPNLYRKRLQRLYGLMTLTSIGFAFLMTVFGRYIIYVVFGSAYLDAVIVLQIYTWAGVAVSLGVAISQYLVVENYTKILSAMTLIGMFLNIILNIILIPQYGIVGAALATTVSYSITTLLILYFSPGKPRSFLLLKSFINKK